METFYFNDIWRMDWGLGNPNKTAALIATLMIAAWSFAYIKRWGFWMALTLFAGLGVCLMHTFSRGGIIALGAGLIPLVIFAPRPWRMARLVGVGAALWIIIGFGVYWETHERIAQGVIKEDRSISNRLELWSAGPAMMVDAPGGWGLGNAGHAYMQWYQPLDRSEGFRTMVNSHLTWLVEFGWGFRFLYVFAWGAIILLCWPRKHSRRLAIPLGIWIAFGVSAVFSSVAESPWLWVVPLMSLVAVLAYRIYVIQWPSPKAWIIPLGAAAMLTLSFWIAGQNDAAVHGYGSYVTIGEGEPAVWILYDEATLGKLYGKSLREYLNGSEVKPPSIGIAFSPDSLPDLGGKKLIIAGGDTPETRERLAALIGSAAETILLTPAFYPQELDLAPERLAGISVIFGEFSQSPTSYAWQQAGHVRRLAGVGNFIPNWPQYLFAKESS